MKHSDTNNQIDAFKSATSKSKRIVGFTGAGISTESGIPDYRSKGGIWDKFQPASSIPSIAKEKGTLLSIITLSEAPLDSYADFVFHLKVEDFINIFQS